MKVLIIGGTALIGPHLMQELLTDGPHHIATITRSGKSYFSETAFATDRKDETKLTEIINDFCPDCIVDMIPFTLQDARTFVSAYRASKSTAHVVAVSSMDIYAAYAKIHGTESIHYQVCPITEEMSLRTALGAEGEAYDKLNVEKTYRESLSNLTILRLPAIYGWPDTTRIDHYLQPMLDGVSEIRISKIRADWKFSRCLHKNAAYAISLCVLAGKAGQHVYNVAEQTAYSDKEWCEKIAALCGWTRHVVLSDEMDTVDLKQNFWMSSDKIRQERNFVEKYDPDEGLKENILFFTYQYRGKNYKKYY